MTIRQYKDMWRIERDFQIIYQFFFKFYPKFIHLLKRKWSILLNMLKRICTYVWLGCSLRILFLGLIPQSHYPLLCRTSVEILCSIYFEKWNQWAWAFPSTISSYPFFNSIRFDSSSTHEASYIPSYHSELMCTRLISNYHRWKIIKEIYR